MYYHNVKVTLSMLCLSDILVNITGNKVHDKQPNDIFKQVKMQFVNSLRTMFMNYKPFTLVGGNIIWWMANLLHAYIRRIRTLRHIWGQLNFWERYRRTKSTNIDNWIITIPQNIIYGLAVTLHVLNLSVGVTCSCLLVRGKRLAGNVSGWLTLGVCTIYGTVACRVSSRLT